MASLSLSPGVTRERCLLGHSDPRRRGCPRPALSSRTFVMMNMSSVLSDATAVCGD